MHHQLALPAIPSRFPHSDRRAERGRLSHILSHKNPVSVGYRCLQSIALVLPCSKNFTRLRPKPNIWYRFSPIFYDTLYALGSKESLFAVVILQISLAKNSSKPTFRPSMLKIRGNFNLF